MKMWFLLDVKDTVHVLIGRRPTNHLFSLFSSLFVLLFSIVLRQLCLLHQSKSQKCLPPTRIKVIFARGLVLDLFGNGLIPGRERHCSN